MRPLSGVLAAAGALAAFCAMRWGSGVAATAVALAGYGGLIAFAALERHRPGMILAAAGLTANALVIAADSGMPVAGRPAGWSEGLHHALTPSDRLTAISDAIHLPGGTALSPGDILLGVGVGVALIWTVAALRHHSAA